MDDKPFTTYTERLLVPTPALLGYHLKPFSLGHSMALREIDSKFISGEYNQLDEKKNIIYLLALEHLCVQNDKTKQARYQLIIEFVSAMIICTTTYDDYKNDVELGKIPELIKEFMDLTLALDVQDLVDTIHRFCLYIQKGTAAPKFNPIATDDSFKGAVVMPEQSIKEDLMSKCGYTRSEALDLPFTETYSSYLYHRHSRCDIELTSQTEYEIIQAAKGKK